MALMLLRRDILGARSVRKRRCYIEAEGKVAIITGGANGMGETEAKMFAREGAKVVIGDIHEEEGRRVEEAISETGGEATFLRLDVTDEEGWNDVVAATVSKYGKLDILVNNAGISGTIDPDIMSSDAWDMLMEINAKGVFLGLKCSVPEMREVGGGSIVNISSISGIVGQDYLHMGYNASKGAVRILTKSAAIQYAKDGIRVNSVHPGVMPPMRTSTVAADPEIRDRTLAMVPMGREGRREEVGYAVLFLASDEASYITGTELVVARSTRRCHRGQHRGIDDRSGAGRSIRSGHNIRARPDRRPHGGPQVHTTGQPPSRAAAGRSAGHVLSVSRFSPSYGRAWWGTPPSGHRKRILFT